MKQRDELKRGRRATELIEEAIHLLRNARAATLGAYFAGTLPFSLGLLFFWSDMARSPFAPRHLADASFGLALLFLWMKFWQTVFTGRLLAQLSGSPAPKLTFVRCRGILLGQTALQSSGLFLLPLALLPTLPFPWVYAFYQNLTVLGDRENRGVGDLGKKAWRQARLWPRQNNALLFIMSGFTFYVFLNWLSVGFVMPHLLKMLFGIDTVFTQSGAALLNTTYIAAVGVLTYLSLDPILKTIYTLRCFYGESVSSGEDLKAELRQYGTGWQGAVAGLVLALSLAAAIGVRADENAPANPPAPPAPAQSVSPPALNQAIERTINQAKYTWRMPREKLADDNEPPGFLSRFFDAVAKMIREWAKIIFNALGDWIQDFFKWIDKLLRKLFHQPEHESDNTSGYGWILWLEILLYTLLAAVIVALGWMIYRAVRERRKPMMVTAEAIQSAPDLRDENVGAEQLPEDGWTKLARELLARGELRLALRAFYLASLAHLAERNLISLARFKSNRDYERELRRRAHSFPALLGAFGENSAVFDRVWYGRHEVSAPLVDEFAANLDKLKGAA